MWPNGWMDQDETWHAGRPRPWPYCVRWGPSSPYPKGEGAEPPIFGPYLLRRSSCRDQDATWYGGGLDPGDFVLDGDRAPLPRKGRSPSIFGPRLLWPNGCIYQDAAWYGGRRWPTRHCVRCGSSSPPLNGHSPPIFDHCPLWPNGWMD